MGTDIHIRYCSCSKTLREKLAELGFEERGSDPEHLNLRQVRRFYKDNEDGSNWLKIEDSYQGLVLFRYQELPKTVETAHAIKDWVPRYKGLSVNKELLEHFSKKGIYHQ